MPRPHGLLQTIGASGPQSRGMVHALGYSVYVLLVRSMGGLRGLCSAYELLRGLCLETTLRIFSCLTTGDSIMVAYNGGRNYYIDIVETKPASAISIIETGCEVDFALPLDYKEPEQPQQPSIPPSQAPDQGFHSE
ncbi:hypothetical protein COCNU_10G005770 [Cocos nucifera]|uniref:Ubiquitin fusion degradation protein UFD1 N-terminal subdomain 2 domain-containing protein n=1 Tax=Cocos nucifera TaxID=13894 RepID=A0A8K0ING8_COCNU|nr:hypothetical protein COCNU_10G005770 [Cocos nucifera]